MTPFREQGRDVPTIPGRRVVSECRCKPEAANFKPWELERLKHLCDYHEYTQNFWYWGHAIFMAVVVGLVAFGPLVLVGLTERKSMLLLYLLPLGYFFGILIGWIASIPGRLESLRRASTVTRIVEEDDA